MAEQAKSMAEQAKGMAEQTLFMRKLNDQAEATTLKLTEIQGQCRGDHQSHGSAGQTA